MEEQLLSVLEQILFCAETAAYGISWVAGAVTWRLMVLAKNQRDWW